MMSTLLRHEAFQTRKALSVILGCAALLLTVSLIPVILNVPIVSSVGMFLAIVATISVTPALMALLIAHHWTTMYGRLGYFTWVVPAKGSTILAAKMLWALVVVTVGIIVTLLALFAVFAANVHAHSGRVVDALQTLLAQATSAGQLALWLGVAGGVLTIIVTAVQVLSALSISAASRWMSLGLGAPLLAVLAWYLASQALNFIAMVTIPLGLAVAGEDQGRVVGRSMGPDLWAAMATGADPQVVGLGPFLVSIAMTAAMWWWAVRTIEHHTTLR